MKILILNGPNLNLLNKRNKKLYGEYSLKSIESIIKKEFPNDEFQFYQSNLEGELINQIQKADEKFDALIINPGGYAHTSVALRDALADTKVFKIEVHLSNLSCRENFRQTLLTASVCDGYISGFKEKSYLAAIYLIHKLVKNSLRKD